MNSAFHLNRKVCVLNRRTVTKTMLSGVALGTLVSRTASAQTPAASPFAITHVDVPGVVLAISPDGRMAAGVVDREFLRVWDVATLEIIAESDPHPEISILDQTSLTWSPDRTALAWSLDAARLGRDSDIYVFDIEPATVSNLTAEAGSDKDAPSLLDLGDSVVDVDMFPSWSASGDDVFFARSTFGADLSPQTRLMRIPRDGGEASEFAVLSSENVFLVSGPMTAFEDSSVLYATWPHDVDGPEHGVFLATPDGEIEGISSGMLASKTPRMQIASVAEVAGKASVISLQNYFIHDPEKPIWVELDLGTGIPTPFEDILSLPTGVDAIDQDLVLCASPAFLTGDDGALSGYLYATADAEYNMFSVWRHELGSSGPEALGTIEREGSSNLGVLQIPRVTVTNTGTAALLFGGWLGTIDLG